MFASPWGAPRATLPGVGELEIVKVARTGEGADVAPGTLGVADAAGVRVACADEWLLVKKFRLAGAPGDPGQLASAGAFEVR
jgi:hypothetical protein